jgi:hypothetical protein
VQAAQVLAGALVEHPEEPAQRGLAGYHLNPQHLGHCGITLQPGHAGEFVRAAEDAADIAQRDIGGIVSVRTGGVMRQDFAQLLTKALFAAGSATRQSVRRGR